MSDVESDTDEKVSLSSVLEDARIHPLESGDRALDAFLLLKVVDSEGDVGWCYRTTSPPNRQELLGAMMIQVDILRKELADEWTSE
jgi:hypothetical protein